jgi:hypothetical protein
MRTGISSIAAGLLLIGQVARSEAVSIGAYAVGNHSKCGVSSIPGTIRELDKLFAHTSLSDIGSKNFYWKEDRVRQSDWAKATDYRQSSEAVSGYDGADSSLISYIASHGITSGGVYKALAGSKEHGGCYISTADLELGNQESRYTILSTCQGLKIGTGTNPTASGENPTRTWKAAANGLNCILGYSNNMADADGYGIYLIDKLKQGNVTLAEAFMSASEAVSKGNIPAVMCYGETEDDAAKFIAESKTFVRQSRSHAAASFVYRKSSSFSPQDKSLSTPEIASSQVVLKPRSIASLISEKGLQESSLVYSEPKTGYFSIAFQGSHSGFNSYKGQTIAVEDAIRVAQEALHQYQFAANDELVISDVSEDVLGGADGIKATLSRKISFKQQIQGLTTQGQAGSIDVTIGAGGDVNRIEGLLVDTISVSKVDRNIALSQLDLTSLYQKAMAEVAAEIPNGEYKIVSERVGYDAGNFFELKQTSNLVLTLEIEATQNGVGRRYIKHMQL